MKSKTNWANGVGKKCYTYNGNKVESETFYYDFVCNGRRYTGNTGEVTRSKAERFVAQKRIEVDGSIGISLDFALNEYNKEMRLKSKNEKYTNRADAKLHEYVKYFGIRRLDDFRASDFTTYLLLLKEKKYSVSSIRHYGQCIKTFLYWCKKKKYISDNTLEEIEVTKPKRADRTFIRVAFTPEEIATLVNGVIPSRMDAFTKKYPTTKNSRYFEQLRIAENERLLYLFLFQTGSRAFSDAGKLVWGDIRFDDARKCPIVLLRNGKGNKEVEYIISQSLFDEFSEEKKKQGAYYKKLPANTDKVFCVNMKSSIRLRKTCKALGIRQNSSDRDRINLHCFRKALGTHCFYSGVDVATTKHLMRHSRIATTEEFYYELRDENVKKAVATLFPDKQDAAPSAGDSAGLSRPG